MKLGRILLLFYCTVFSVFVAFGAINIGLGTKNFLAAIFFLPVLAHFALSIFTSTKTFRLLLYYDFILTTIMTIAGFIGTKSESQLISAILFAPLAIYFWQLVLPKRSKQIPLTQLGFEILPITPEPVSRLKKVQRNFDQDRRMFLKLIGSAGMTLFFFSVFTKRAEASFFGSVPGPGTVAIKDTTGTAIDPAIKQPTDGYKITEIDDSSPTYYGFVNKNGDWFIQKENSSGSYRYTKGSSGFSTNWTNRASLTYDYFNMVFGS